MDVSRVVDASLDRTWAVLTETRYWSDWGPSVRSVDPADVTIAPGLTGRVRTPVGLWLPFEILDVSGDGDTRRWTWRVAGVPATGHRAEALGGGRTRVVFEVPAIAAPYAAVCHVALRRIADAV